MIFCGQVLYNFGVNISVEQLINHTISKKKLLFFKSYNCVLDLFRSYFRRSPISVAQPKLPKAKQNKTKH